MTELQLRLWCLWMCEEFADFGESVSGDQDAMRCAMEGADDLMRHAVRAMAAGMFFPTSVLRAWELSERMP